MAGYTKDAYVIDIEFAQYPNAVSEVRTQKKDAITKTKY